MRLPDADECAPFYAPYIAAVEGDSLAEVLDLDTAQWAGLLRSVPPGLEQHRYAPGKWSLRELTGHVIDSERVFQARALAFARGDASPYPGFDENAWVAVAGADSRPLADLASEMAAVRTATKALMDGLGPETWERRGTASGCEFTVRSVFWIIAGHSQHHRRKIRELYLPE